MARFSSSRVAPAPVAPVVQELPAVPESMAWSVVPEPEPAKPQPPAQAANPLLSDKFLDAKVRLHRRLIQEINLSALEKLPEDEMRQHVQQLVTQYILVERLALNQQELNDFVSEILDEMTGLGPLEPLLKDPSINDILINGHESTFIERGGLLEPVACRFKDEAHLLRIINTIVSAVGRRVDESHPLCDARLLDGSRVNVAVRPIGVDGPLVSIRKFSKKPFNLTKLVDIGALKPQMAELLAAAVKSRITTIISGGTGSGKTTMLNALSAFISDKERLITIEDAAELQLQQPHVARMETRPPNIEGKGEIRQRLVKNAACGLTHHPGECRGEEALICCGQNTGHEGSMATIHANCARRFRPAADRTAGPMTIARSGARSPPRSTDRTALRSPARGHPVGPKSPAWRATSCRCRRSQTVRTGTRGWHREGSLPATGIRPRFSPPTGGRQIPGYFDPEPPIMLLVSTRFMGLCCRRPPPVLEKDLSAFSSGRTKNINRRLR